MRYATISATAQVEGLKLRIMSGNDDVLEVEATKETRLDLARDFVGSLRIAFDRFIRERVAASNAVRRHIPDYVSERLATIAFCAVPDSIIILNLNETWSFTIRYGA